MARALAGRRLLQGGGPLLAAEVLRAGDAALPQRHAAHRPHPQLHHRRRAGALQVDARLQRAAPHGLGRLRAAGRERRHRQPAAPARVDPLQHRLHEGAAPALRLQLRLGPRDLHLRARVLPLEPVVLPAECWSAAWPTAPRRWSTGAPSAPPCWPTSRWWTAAAGVTRTPPSSSANWSSGSSRSPPTRTSCCDDIGKLEGGWPERVLTMQRNWIGRSEGTDVDFRLAETGEPIRVFTTRVDTIFGATCMILAPEHPLVARLVDRRGQGQGQADDRRPRPPRSRRSASRKASSPATTPSIRTAARRFRSGSATSC